MAAYLQSVGSCWPMGVREGVGHYGRPSGEKTVPMEPLDGAGQACVRRQPNKLDELGAAQNEKGDLGERGSITTLSFPEWCECLARLGATSTGL